MMNNDDAFNLQGDCEWKVEAENQSPLISQHRLTGGDGGEGRRGGRLNRDRRAGVPHLASGVCRSRWNLRQFDVTLSHDGVRNTLVPSRRKRLFFEIPHVNIIFPSNCHPASRRC